MHTLACVVFNVRTSYPRLATADCRCASASVLEETVEVVTVASLERVQQRTAEQFVDVPQILKETVEMVRFVPRERAQQSRRANCGMARDR